MSRDEIMSTLSASKIYLDLGTHPGMDRFPREAGLLGCVVMTNLRGSAGNDIDVPINRELFKFDDDKVGFELTIEREIRQVLNEPDRARSKQAAFAEWSASAEKRFYEETKQILNKIVSEAYSTTPSEKLIAKAVDQLMQERDQLMQERDQLMQERDQLMQERDQLIYKNKKIISSLSWKITKLPRFVAQIWSRVISYKK